MTVNLYVNVPLVSCSKKLPIKQGQEKITFLEKNQ